MLTKNTKRIIAIVLSIVLVLDLLDALLIKNGIGSMHAQAAAKDYAVSFKWDISSLTTDGKAEDGDNHPDDPSRIVELSSDGKTLSLTELDDEYPVLKTTFSFNLKKAVDPGNLTFSITGMDALIRDGVIDMGMNDPNLVKTWDIQKVDGEDKYIFTNKVRVTSNNETTFTWQFNSRDAVNLSDIELMTECTVTEVEEIDNGDETTTIKTTEVKLDPNDLRFQYASVHDEHEVNIVCQKLEDLVDTNNLNTEFDWRSYYSVIGLKGLDEYEKDPSKVHDENPVLDDSDPEIAHYIAQNTTEQKESRHSRGIKKADYFIEVSIPYGFTADDIMVVDRNGSYVPLATYTINTQDGPQTMYGFYDFKGRTNFDVKAGESYSCTYNVGLRDDTINNSTQKPVIVNLEGHFIATYDDESLPIDISNTAAHSVENAVIQYVSEGDGNWIDKHNKYEMNYSGGYTYNGITYYNHSKHYNPQNQLLFDTIFGGKVVTYHLDSYLVQVKENDKPQAYDIIFEDGAPAIQNLSGKDDRTLNFDEYDFSRVKIERLIDGETVSDDPEQLSGFDFDLYGRTGTGDFNPIGSGNTKTATEFFLPEGIDEIKIIIHGVAIRSRVDVSVDIRYNIHEDEYDHIYIDSIDGEGHEYDTIDNKKVRREDTNQGTRLVNTFTCKKYVGTYDINNAGSYSYNYLYTKHSNTWLRDSTTVIDSYSHIEKFVFHDALGELTSSGQTPAPGFVPNDYYSTVITAGGTVQADSEKGLNHFVVYSKIPDGVSPSDGWLDAVKDSFVFSATLQGTGEQIDKDDVFAENAVSFYYDSSTNSICAEFNFDAFALKMDDLTSCTFSYPAEISLAAVKAKEEAVHTFRSETYVTVLDKNVKLSPAENKTLLVAGDNPYGLNVQMSKHSDKTTISAMGSQKSNESTKDVKSYYNNWILDKSTTVDGSNTDHLDTDTGRMTSEYTYQMSFHRFTSDDEHVIDPMMIDIVEGSEASAWQGKVMSVTFDSGSYPSAFTPEVYYLPTGVSWVVENTVTEDYDYRLTNTVIQEAISHFEMYGDEWSADDEQSEEEQQAEYTANLAYYNTLKYKILNQEDGWKKATNNDSVWVINRDDIYAVAVIFVGDYVVPDKYLKISANLNMKAPAIVNDNNIEHINNNRATYNDSHFFVKGKDKNDLEFPMYSVSSRSLVLLNHSVELEKVSAKSGKRLTGASFSVYTDGGCDDNSIVQYYDFNRKLGKNEQKSMKDMPVDLSGILTLDLAPGIYYYQETVAPAGFNKDENVYRFRAVSDSNTVYYYSVGLKTQEELANECLIVNEAEYDLYKDTVYSGKQPVENAVGFHVYNSNGMAVNKFYLNDSGEYKYDADDGNLDTVCFNGGQITISMLPAGSYFIGKTPDDPDGYSFSVADKSSASFRAFKKTVLSSNVAYRMYKKAGTEISANDEICHFTDSNNGYYTLATTGVDIIRPASTSGVLNVSSLDPNSEYYLVSEEVPAYFKKSNGPVLEISGQTEFSKIVAEQLVKTGRLVVEDDPIESANARFEKVDETAGRDENGAGKVKVNDAEYSMYLVESDGSETKLYFRFDDETKTYYYIGTTGGNNLTANLKSQVLDDKDGQFYVEGIPYGVFFVQESVAPSGYQIDTTKHYFRVSASTIDLNGNLIFGNAESTGDDSEDPESTESNTMQILTLSDNEVLSTIELNKTEEVNPDKYLGYATYKMFRLNDDLDWEEVEEAAKEAVANSRGNTSSEDFIHYWRLYRTVSTDISGQATVRGVPFGVYLLYEDQPPKGYKWNNDSAQWETWTEKSTEHEKNSQIIIISAETLEQNSTIYIDEDGNEEITYHTFYALHKDERKTGDARLLKKNAAGIGLTDGNFTLYQVEFTENEINAAIARYQNGLTVAEYNVLNTEERESYLTAVGAMTDAEREAVLLKMTLTEADVILSEHFENGKPKTDGTDTIDTVIKQNLKTSADPSLGATETVSGLDWGVYYFYEVKSPSGYQQDTTPQMFSVSAENVGSTIEVNMVDDKTYGKIWLYKQAKAGSEDNHTKLFGAQFELYTKANEKVYAVPGLMIYGLHNTEEGLNGGRKEFFVSGFTVVDKNNIRFDLKDNVKNCGCVTITYDESNVGNITAVKGDDAFRELYGDPAYGSDTDTRLTYYAVSADNTQVFDDGSKKYRAITAAELSCITNTYVTADKGGQFCVRGLDWNSYYFRETVPPEGYGLAEDVTFTVNSYNCDNQFLKCEDPSAKAAIIIDKEVPDKEYFKAYGDPTFMFKIYGLAVAEPGDVVSYVKNSIGYKKTGDDYTLAIHLSELTSGSAMVNVPVGQYLIEELPVARYKCVGLEMLSGSNIKVKSAGIDTLTSDVISTDGDKYDINNGESTFNPWTAFCDLSGGDSSFGEMVTFHVKFTNDIRRYDNFSHVSFADNRIPGQEYITAFKPLYKPIETVYSGDENPHIYVIDLDAAMASEDEDFEAVLSYNTDRTVKLTDLTCVQFKNNYDAQSPITGVSFDGTTLSVTVSDPVSLAGQSIKLDVGYCEDAGFTTYDESNTHMVKGEMYITFSEVKASVRKRVILRNDVTNKSYFPNMEDPDHDTHDGISLAVTYVKEADADWSTAVGTSENPVYSSKLKPIDPAAFVIKGWYLLDGDGRPVLDKEGNVMLFTEEEIKEYIFTGEYPDYLISGDLLPDGMTNPANVESINTFAFQAEVEKITAYAKMISTDGDQYTAQNILSYPYMKGRMSWLVKGNTDMIRSVRRITNAEGSAILQQAPGNNTYFRRTCLSIAYDNYCISNSANNLTSNTVTYLSQVYGENVVRPSIDSEDAQYQIIVYAYSVLREGGGYDIYYYTENDTNPIFTGQMNNLLQGRQYWKLSDISGLEYWNVSGATSFVKIFSELGNDLQNVTIDYSPILNWDVSNVTDMEQAFNYKGGVKIPAGLDFSNWDLSSCTNFYKMFSGQTNYIGKSIQFKDGIYTVDNNGTLTKTSS